MKMLQSTFFFIAFLLSAVAGANANRLYETNLLKQDSTYKVDPAIYSSATLRSQELQIAKEPNLKPNILLSIASIKAHQGRLTEALDDLSLVATDFRMNDFYEERAEIKSLLGFDESAIQDMDKSTMSPQYPSWRTMWHRSVILERAGKQLEADLFLRKALANLQRFKTENILSKTLLEVAKERQIIALEPDKSQSDTALSMIQTLMNSSSAELTRTLKTLGLNEKSREENKSLGQTFYWPLSADSPFRYVSITPDGHQIRVYLDSTICILTPDAIRKQFDAATQQELSPESTGGCSPAKMTLISRKLESGISQFIFDGAKDPALDTFFIAFKNEANH